MIARPSTSAWCSSILALVAVLGAVLLAMWGLKDRAAYFYTPADIAAGKAAAGQGDAPRRDGRARLGQARGRRRHDALHRRGRRGDACRSPIAASSPTCSAKAAASSPKASWRPTARSSPTTSSPSMTSATCRRELGNQAAEHKAGQTLKR